VRDKKSSQSDRARIIGSAQIRVNNRRGMVRPRTGNFARIFGMFVIRKHSRNVATTAHRFNEAFIRSQHLTCQVSRPSTYRTASNASDCQKRNDQDRKTGEIAAGRIFAGSLSSVDPWLSGGLSRELAGVPRYRAGIANSERSPGRHRYCSPFVWGHAPVVLERPPIRPRPPRLQPSVSRQPLANPYYDQFDISSPPGCGRRARP
jgi:hypothetical protein